MPYLRSTSLVLAVLASACSAANTPLGQEQTTAVAIRGNANLIVRAEFEGAVGQTAWRAVSNLRPRWLQPVRGASFIFEPAYARVIIDQSMRGDLQELRSLVANDVTTMRRLSPADATTKYGTGFAGGAIEVTTRGR
jgi:hypothetical protein